jgi:hypothetical protein
MIDDSEPTRDAATAAFTSQRTPVRSSQFSQFTTTY